jgi:protein-arginine kinase activator protein McsA
MENNNEAMNADEKNALLQDLEKQLEEIKEKKSKWVAKKHYEAAARLRDDEKILLAKIEELKK